MRWLLLASMSLFACAVEAPAPDKPTWAEDVLPILRANCFSCHGATANYKKYQQKRWDVYDRTAEPYVRLGFGQITEEILDSKGNPVPLVTVWGAKDEALMVAYIETDDPKVRMPPPPATKLTPNQIQTIKNWVDNNFEEGAHHPNHKATITWLDKSARRVDVADADGDTVVGRLDCNGVDVGFDHSGGFTLPKDATLPCTGSLYDGFAETAVNLK